MYLKKKSISKTKKIILANELNPFYVKHFCIIPSLFYNMFKAEGTIARNYFAEKNIEHEVRAQIKVFQVFVLVESFEWHNDSSKVLGDVNY